MAAASAPPTLACLAAVCYLPRFHTLIDPLLSHPISLTCGGPAVASRMHMAAASAGPYDLKNTSSLVASRCSSSCRKNETMMA